MALAPGTRLGVYAVTAPLGEGGMGQVWRATDTTLGRQVAIKILPDAFASDPQRLARFEREARTLASLNHPQIAAIYGFEKSSGVHALVMELVEGDDLSQRIAEGAIPIHEALSIAKQIADALEAAHEQGIIHRDLKPANIKVRADGTVKVLDFGLAKATAEGSRLGGAADSPTLTAHAMTMGGVILGTVPYMAPEQAKGKPVDKRADLWAFGAVLYEMLARRRAFRGEDAAETIAAVMGRDPEWSALPTNTPASIRKLLRRCLEKDRKQRLDSAAAARLEIEDALSAPAPDDTRATTVRSSRARLAWAVSGTSIAALGATVLAWAPWRSGPVPPETRLEITTPATDSPAAFALSPDGRQFVFVASGASGSQLWLRPMASTTAQPLAGTEGATFPFWSPDGRTVAFFADNALKRIELDGGVPQTVAPARAGRGGSWQADGVILFGPGSGTPLYRVPASGGPAVAVTALDSQTSHRLPSFLPDGRRFLFYAQGTPETTGIYLGALDAPDTHRLTAAEAAGAYLPALPGSTDKTSLAERDISGWLLWIKAGTLVGQRLDPDGPALVGEPVTLADSVVVDTTSNAAAVSASASGLVAYRTSGGAQRQLTWVDRSGKVSGSLGAPNANQLSPGVSPDGRQAVVDYVVQGNHDLWLVDDIRTSRLTFDAAPDQLPLWSPDGRRIAFRSNRAGSFDLYQKSSSGAGEEDLLVASSQSKVATDWSADGRFLLYASSDPQSDWDLWVLPMEGDRAPWVFLKTPFNERTGAFSPDGRWVAYQSNESERMEIYVRPFAMPSAAGSAAQVTGGQWQVSTAGGIAPRWRRDGRELYYLDPAGALMAAPITVSGTTLTPGAPVALFTMRIVSGGADTVLGRQYDVARDGRFLINRALDDASAPITLVQNWSPPEKEQRRVPH